MKSQSGLLLPISALPSSFGIGDFGPSAYQFIDFCRQANQHLWQILPLNPTDGINGHSPYSSPSAFAGNSLFISPELLREDKLLSANEVKQAYVKDGDRVDYAKVEIIKKKLLTKAYQRFKKYTKPIEYYHFIERSAWLHDYALFVTIKQVNNGASWDQWPLPLRKRSAKALKDFAVKHADVIEYVKFVQFVFYQQWVRLRAYANSNGVSIIGDIPIYVNDDSADVWANVNYFQIDAKGHLKFVSGCPPDYFSKTGQRWGNPTYNWVALKKDRYDWWVKRIKHNLAIYDILRIDHFRGFLGFWQIPAHEKLAVFGRWVKAPGLDFFKTLSRQFGQLPIIAEDLGEITPDVISVMKKLHFPGMRVLLFGFGGNPKVNPHVPGNYKANIVAYTGTHDNNTIQGWLKTEAKDYERANIAKVLGVKQLRLNLLHWAMIEVLMQSKANTVIIPVQDLLGLGANARLNTPATKVNNWAWRLMSRQLKTTIANTLKKITVKAGRNEN